MAVSVERMELGISSLKAYAFQAKIDNSFNIGSQLTALIVFHNVGCGQAVVSCCAAGREGRKLSFVPQALIAECDIVFGIFIECKGLVSPACRRRVVHDDLRTIGKLDDIYAVKAFVEDEMFAVSCSQVSFSEIC